MGCGKSFVRISARSLAALSMAAAVGVGFLSGCTSAADHSFVTAEDQAMGRKTADTLLAKRALPFSFTYGGQPSSELLAQWKSDTQEKSLEHGKTQQTTTWKDPAGNLTVRMVSVRYNDAPACEWTVYLRNDGKADTKLVENLRGIDAPIGTAPAAAASSKKREMWTSGKNFPAAASGERFELYRGYGNEWRPLTAGDAYEGGKRFAAANNAPWIAADSKDGTMLMMPAQGIEPAGADEKTGKSPAAAFVAPINGLYRISGTITKVGQGGDGVEWAIHNFGGHVYRSGAVTGSEPVKFDQVAPLSAGEKIGLGIASGETADGDLCRVQLDVAQVSNLVDGDVLVRTNRGSDMLDTDFEPLVFGLGNGDSIPLSARGGRPSEWLTMPYFNVQLPTGGGTLVAIGWPGQWDARFSRDGDKVRLQAGQEEVHTVLHPGEEIRTPLIALVGYAGNDPQHGQNVWRRWMVDYNMPRVDGKLRGPFVAANSSHQTAEMIKANEANQKGYIQGYVDHGIKLDYWWMDAGWYINDGSWINVGTWKVDPKRFPNGLRAITDFGRSKGVETILWFEPERVTKNSELYDQHPNFLLSAKPDYNNPTTGLFVYRTATGAGEPNLTINPLDRARSGSGLTWKPKQVSLHPGPDGEYSVARFTAPVDGDYQVKAHFFALDKTATTDVHVMQGDKSLFSNLIDVDGHPAEQNFQGKVTAKAGETIDFIVGRGNGHYEADTTGLDASISGPDGKTYDVSKDLDVKAEAHGAWSYGNLPGGDKPATDKFVKYPQGSAVGDGQEWKLLNLGLPEARKWITDRVDSIIKEQGVNLYRQDFNISPLPYWRSSDADDRRGLTENQYVQGYLAYWDALRERNPKIWIDSCASGGRRNDLETMRRAVPLTRSDRLFIPIGQQGHNYGICQWLPDNGTGVLVGKSAIFGDMPDGGVDSYYFRSQIAPTMIVAADTTSKTIDFDALRKLINEYRAIAPAYWGDYYPLTPHSLDADKWIAWQFDLPNEGTGMIQAFRRDKAGDPSMRFKLSGLDRAATYQVTDVDQSDAVQTLPGSQLLDEGYEVKIAKQPGAATIRYAKVK